MDKDFSKYAFGLFNHLSLKTFRKFSIRSLGLSLCVVFLAATLVSWPTDIEAKKSTLRLTPPKKEKKSNQNSIKNWIEADSVLLDATSPQIEFSGYDKPYNSKKETFLFSNNSSRYIAGAVVKIEYFDLQDRMINAREETIIKSIPPGETRLIAIKSFDPQSTLYYHRSRAPRSGGQPFDVKISILSLLLPK